MFFYSTRNRALNLSASAAIVKGISDDGGLFVPSSFPVIEKDEWETLLNSSYSERAALVMGKYLTDFTYDELLEICNSAYAKFDGEDPAPVVKTRENEYILELWHGPTSAFKDMALTVLPYLLTASKKKLGNDNKTLILVATSGDTGKAALEGFSDVPGTEIIVFYPNAGVSPMQELQMVSSRGENVHVSALNGNFDDAQTAVKTIFTSDSCKAELKNLGYDLSSANSINFGRLVPQVVYYVSAYCDLVNAGEINMGDKISFSVPCGNFGNILAGYYAKRMGLPVDKLICASNTNKILYDFISTGTYDVKREFYKTVSPSMDILVSSNLERFLFELGNRDDKALSEKMKALKENGVYSVSSDELKMMQETFLCGWTSEEDTTGTIEDYFDDCGYALDPHTAVAINVNQNLIESGKVSTKIVTVSTASAYKFPTVVLEALTGKKTDDAFLACEKLEEYTAEAQPEGLAILKSLPRRHNTVCDRDKIFDTVVNFLK